MYCSACGKEIPQNSSFCLHCGSNIQNPQEKKEIDWIIQDYTFIFPNDEKPILIGRTYGNTKIEAREEYWNKYNNSIRKQIQKRMNLGWEPIDKPGPDCIDLKEQGSYVTPLTFRLPMRIRKDLIADEEELFEEVTIVLYREPKFYGKALSWGIHIDDKKVGSIGNGKTETISISPGEHIIFIKGNGGTSKKIPLDLNPGDSITLNCTAKMMGVNLRIKSY